MPLFSGWENPSTRNGLFDPEDGFTTLPRNVLATCDPIRSNPLRYAYLILGNIGHRRKMCAKVFSVNLELVFDCCLQRMSLLSKIISLLKINSVTLAEFTQTEVGRTILRPEKKIFGWNMGIFFNTADSDYKVEHFLINSRNVTCWHTGLHPNYRINLKYFANWPKFKDVILLYARPMKCYLLWGSLWATRVSGPLACYKILVTLEHPTTPRTST